MLLPNDMITNETGRLTPATDTVLILIAQLRNASVYYLPMCRLNASSLAMLWI